MLLFRPIVMVKEKVEKLSRIKEWRKKKKEKNREKNKRYNAATVRHICFDLDVVKRGRKSVFRVPVALNEEIMASM